VVSTLNLYLSTYVRMKSLLCYGRQRLENLALKVRSPYKAVARVGGIVLLRPQGISRDSERFKVTVLQNNTDITKDF
jgi:hypothetical protein